MLSWLHLFQSSLLVLGGNLLYSCGLSQMEQHGFALVNFSFSVTEGSCTENKKTPKLLNEHYVPISGSMALLAKNAPPVIILIKEIP